MGGFKPELDDPDYDDEGNVDVEHYPIPPGLQEAWDELHAEDAPKAGRPPPPRTLAKARAVRAVQRETCARRPKNQHGHRDGLTPGDTLTIRKSHVTADNPDHVIVRAGGKFQWGDRIYPNARRLLADVTGNPNHHLTARRYFRLED
jgi:hypothetical protein